MEILKNEPMSSYTSFKIGGPADEFCSAESVEEIASLIQYAKDKGIDYTIIGNGSNLLVGDKGIRGLVIRIAQGFDNIKVTGNLIECECGILLSRLAATAYKNGLSGFEFASGIPGTLGGAVYMNAGAYGGEMKDVIESVTYLENGKISTIYREDLDFGYRHSYFSDRDCVILSAVINLEKAPMEEIGAKMEDLKNRRNEKQPINMPSAGSTFKRPEGYFAGKLIQDSGLKGYRIGGAMVSEKHSGFIINAGDATAADVRELIDYVQKTVKDKFGVDLETEVRFLGEF